MISLIIFAVALVLVFRAGAATTVILLQHASGSVPSCLPGPVECKDESGLRPRARGQRGFALAETTLRDIELCSRILWHCKIMLFVDFALLW